MNDKFMLILVIGVIAIILFDVYSEYSEEVRKDEILSQQIAAQTLLQQGMQGAPTDDRGFLGNFMSNIPLIGGFY